MKATLAASDQMKPSFINNALGGSNGPEVLNKLAIVARKPKEALNYACRVGLGPISHSLDLLWIHGHLGG